MTFRDAFSEVQGLCQNYCPENFYPVAVRHLKHASLEFCRTPALVGSYSIALTGARDYTLPKSRLGRVYRVENSADANMIYTVNVLPLDDLTERWRNQTTTGTYVRACSIFGRTLRVAPLPSSGTITVYAAPQPILSLRDTTRDMTNTATGGSTSTCAASTITQGVVNNRAGVTDYFEGCRIVFDSGNAASQSSFITSANEGASAITFTFNPSVSTAIANNDTFHIEDVLEVPDQYVPGCINYAAGMICALDKDAKGVAQALLDSYQADLSEAKGKPFGWQPGMKSRLRDYTEGNAWGWYG